MKDNTMEIWFNSSYLTSANQFYIEELYEKFLNDPNSIDANWHTIFNNLSISKMDIQSSSEDFLCVENRKKRVISKNLETMVTSYSVQEKIYRLIEAFRLHGYKHTQLDPLGMQIHSTEERLNLAFYKFTDKDLEKEFYIDSFAIPNKMIKIIDLYNILKKIYCGPIGIEYMHIGNKEQIFWIQKKFESCYKGYFSTSLKQKQLLNEIIQSVNIEQYLHITFPGSKRFSLEGGDVLTPMLKEMIRYAAQHQIKKVVLSMAHRGRLNVLINVLNKPPRDLFAEFSDKNKKINTYSGDVKYHQGFSSIIKIKNTYVNISLLPNPSHLEIISPVAMGFSRAYIDSLNDDQSKTHSILPISIHGDAAISGQGIVQETFNMAEVPAYNIGGTVRIIINNQIGFTTSNPKHLRSSQHCTDIGKMFQTPIFHVNADDPEKVIFVVRAALTFRNTFKHDVLIDLVCYRRYGHNEVDDPNVTQPLMYKKIRQHPTLYTMYSEYLKNKGIVTDSEISDMVNKFQNHLNDEKSKFENNSLFTNNHKCLFHQSRMIQNQQKHIQTEYNYLKKLSHSISVLPKNFKVHPRVNKIYQARIDMAKGNRLFDWGGAEILAYATLLDHGVSVRLSGEDSARGTFFHRHAIVYNQDNGDFYIPLSNISKHQGNFFIWDSVLSEEATLAFEYGYSIYSSPKTLVIWEAQFGDFANGAQIVIDQFISAGEQKWGQTCNLVLLLPHGYEGQGPEHSSARLERYLQLCAENNMKVCVPTTPSQMYHLLRHQALFEVYKPLIVITPKSLLRHSMVHSSFDELTTGNFQEIIEEKDANINSQNVKCVLICTGKIYYDLIETREKNKKYDIAIIRIEQLYPFPIEVMCKIFNTYEHVKRFIWCQEEPKNQGAWHYSKDYLYKIIPNDALLHYIGQPDCAAPATGYFSSHQKQHITLLNRALDIN